MRYLTIIIVLMTLIAYGPGCAGEKLAPPQPGTILDYNTLVDNLRKAGATVTPGDEVSQPFFSVKGRLINVNGGDVQVFEYKDAAADNEAKLVSPDGGTVGTSSILWVAPPHFYKTGRVIVLYLGQDARVLDALKGVLGEQFAGR